ncbi:MAG: monovalent cation/H(+) antiporter subunit G [Thermoflexales bacterium]
MDITELRFLAATLAVVIGTLFSLIGILGLVRLPDVYARMHAVGKVSTFGVVLLTVAAVLTLLFAWSKALVLIMMLVFTGPLTSHAIGSGAYRLGIPMRQALRDDLARERIQD